jgi:adenylate kinase family enzyme
MIILEGPDGSGKSTLAKLIKIEYPDYVITHSPGPCPKEIFKERVFWNIELCKIKHIIVDRITIISESIYGKVLRNGSYITEQNIRDFLGKFYQSKYNTIVFCNQRFKQVRNNKETLYIDQQEKIKLELEVEGKTELLRAGYIDFFYYWKNIFQNVNYFELNNFEDYIKLFKKLKETQ